MSEPVIPAAIEAVFAKLLVTYGQRLTNMLAGVPVKTVKAHWAHELAGMPDWAIAHGLRFLPASFPPTVLEFKALCQGAEPPQRPALSAPEGKPAPERVRAAMSRLGRSEGPRDPLAWAKSLKRRHEAGDARLTRFQIDAYKRALRLGVPQ